MVGSSTSVHIRLGSHPQREHGDGYIPIHVPDATHVFGVRDVVSGGDVCNVNIPRPPAYSITYVFLPIYGQFTKSLDTTDTRPRSRPAISRRLLSPLPLSFCAEVSPIRRPVQT